MTDVANSCGGRLECARSLVRRGDGAAAKLAYMALLQRDPTHLPALLELAALAHGSGHRTAARSALAHALHYHPTDPTAYVQLGDLLFEDGEVPKARVYYERALRVAPSLAEAHQGLGRALAELRADGADAHLRLGFTGHAIERRRFRGAGSGIPLLLLATPLRGNLHTRHWLDDRRFAVTLLYPEYFDIATPLPEHALLLNAIADADIADGALVRAAEIVARSAAPVINPPERVRGTGREVTALRLAGIAGLIVPKIRRVSRRALLEDDAWAFPVLLRAPGFHTGRHFVRIDSRDALAPEAAEMPGDDLLAIEYFDSRGADGMARKYRVMLIGGELYPLHLAISQHWKTHYFTAAMAEEPAHREEERRFLADMPAVLGETAMTVLARIASALGLDYAGVDFALAADGSVLLFEANATMVINPPEPGEIWKYRREPIATALAATARLLTRHFAGSEPDGCYAFGPYAASNSP